ncbi:hypothetical protein MNBD_NITROSPINAE01-1448 [hydrothermal vent metagenome]|uniref:Glycosyltransferase 2-like domain-containing protein n=1 Tax=hydrothermal vent metagenome TaxID=652676 RepID=A0A3B1BW97_9ZZZZ
MYPQFSILTTVFDTNPQFLSEAAQSIFSQCHTDFEWIILDNGSTKTAVKKKLRELGNHTSVTLLHAEQNLGIIGGMRRCIDEAVGNYLVPMDSDDMLTPEALTAIAKAIKLHDEPAFLFSDEDLLIDDKCRSPFRRPGWDPVLNLCTSYIWHLCAFRRKIARDLDVYTDNKAQWCHDWDTLFRFVNAGHIPIHLPQVLYHWRRHRESSTNRQNPAADSIKSQNHLLSCQLERLQLDELFEIDIFPIDRGAKEPWLRRKKQNTQPFHLLLEAGSVEAGIEKLQAIRDATDYPFTSATIFGCGQPEPIKKDSMLGVVNCIPRLESLFCNDYIDNGLVALVREEVFPEGMMWPWEAIGMKQLHPDTALFSCRILDKNRIVIGGGETADSNGNLQSPYVGLKETDGGNFAMALKQQSVNGIHHGFFISENDILKKAIGLPSPQISPVMLARNLAEIALKENRRILFSPLITGVVTNRHGLS